MSVALPAVWRASRLHAAGLLGAFLLTGVVLGTVAFSITLGVLSPGGLDNPNPNVIPALIVGALVLLAVMAPGVAFVRNRLRSRVQVTDSEVVVRIGRGKEQRFYRDSTTFSAFVNRSFLNGVPSTGESRTLMASGRGGIRHIVLPLMPRRAFSLLMHTLQTDETRINLDEIRTIALTKVPRVSRLHAADDNGGAGTLLPVPNRTDSGPPQTARWPFNRRSILLRTLRNLGLSVLAVLVAGVFLWLSFLVPQPVSILFAFLGSMGGLAAAGSSLLFFLRLPWQWFRIPVSLSLTPDELVVGRARFALADLTEISLTPPSYPSHARTLTVRPRRGLRRRWLLGHDQPGALADAAVPAYAGFARSLTNLAFAAGVTLVWDLE